MYYRRCPSRLLTALFSLIILASIHTGAYAASSSCPTCLPSFDTPRLVFDGSGIVSVITADFNGDGKADLAAANANSVSLMLGDGLGGFGTAKSFGVGTLPLSMAAGDFNGDGKLDLAVINKLSKNISILLGDGAGNFGAASNVSVADEPSFVVTGDFNGDGKLDLAVNVGSGCFSCSSVSSDTLSVLLGDGAGSFGAPKNSSLWLGRAFLRAGDFNLDGKLDLAAESEGSGGMVVLGDGAGGFGASIVLAPHQVPGGFDPGDRGQPAVGDFNGDGKLDAAFFASRKVRVFSGDGAGGFTQTGSVDLRAFSGYLDAADFDGDGRLDLINIGALSGSFIFQGDGAGGLSAPIKTDIQGLFLNNGGAFADFDSDGKTDVAWSYSNAPEVPRSQLFVKLNRTVCGQPVVCASDAAAAEGDSGTTDCVVEVSLTSPSDKTVTVDYETAAYATTLYENATAGSDYKPVSGTLTFRPGTTKQTVAVSIIGDRIPEQDQTFRLRLSKPTNAGVLPEAEVSLPFPGGGPFADPPLVTILDDDPLAITVSDATVMEGDSGTTSAVFKVTSSEPAESPVFVTFSTSDGTAKASGAQSDYAAVSNQTFRIDAGQTSVVVGVPVKGDTEVEATETFFGNLTSAYYNLNSTPRDGTVTLARARGTGTIIDDDSTVNSSAPILLDEERAGRAVALDSVTLTHDPFTLDNPFNFSADGRTRVMLFARNLTLQPGEGASAVTAEAVDSGQNVHALEVEFVGALPGVDGVTQIVVRLADDLPALGDVRLRVRAHSLPSNEVFISLQPRAGG